MADRVEREEQLRVVASNTGDDLVENIRMICFMVRDLFRIKIFMFAACIPEGEFRGACGGGDKHIGSIYYYDIQEHRKFGSLDVYEIQTGGGQLILPGVFQGDDSIQALSSSHLPSDFHSFPNRTDYRDIHRVESDFQEIFQREYNNQGVINDEGESQDTDDTAPNETESTPIHEGRRKDIRYRRIAMKELTDIIHSRHDPCTPSMKDIEQRMRTFHGWRINGTLPWPAYQMAQAGLFYTGTGDQVECFHCGFCVREWDETPLVTHVRWIPGCRFLRDTFPLDVIYGILFNRKEM